MKIIVAILLGSISFFSSVGQKPAYTFSVKAGIDKETVNFLGGEEKVRASLKQMFDTINYRFNDTCFYASYHFSIDWNAFYIYDGPSAPEVHKPHPGHDYLVVIDGLRNYENEGGGGWSGGTTQAIYHYRGLRTGVLQDPFTKIAIDGIVHEFGHARGVPDLYAMAVDSAKNPVNKEKFRPVHSVMNECYGVRTWDSYSINLINLSAGKILDIDSLLLACFPAGLQVRVTDSKGKAVKKARVNFYPVKWYSYAVQDSIILQGTTNRAGIYTCTENPFKPGKAGIDCGMYCNNLLIEVSKGNRKTYRWLPLYEFQNAYFDKKRTYELILTVN